MPLAVRVQTVFMRAPVERDSVAHPKVIHLGDQVHDMHGVLDRPGPRLRFAAPRPRLRRRASVTTSSSVV